MSPQLAPRPTPTPRPQPRPAGPANPTSPSGPKERVALRDDVWFRIGVVAGAVGALLLITHYFEPFLLLAALPVKEWREHASQALPHAQRHRRRPPSPASGTAALATPDQEAAVPSSFGGAV